MLSYNFQFDTSDQLIFPHIVLPTPTEDLEHCKENLLRHLFYVWHGLIPVPDAVYTIDFDTFVITEMKHNGPSRMKEAQSLIEGAMRMVESEMEYKNSTENYAISWKIVEV